MTKTPSSSIDPVEQSSTTTKPTAKRARETIEQHLAEIREEIDELLHHMTVDRDPDAQPLFWGWSLDLDEEDNPVVTTFDNIREQFEEMAERFTEPGLRWTVDRSAGIVTVTADLPGASEDAVDVTVDQQTVTVRAETDEERFHASCTLPLRLDPDSAKASLAEGELSIEIPFEAQAKGKPVTVPVTAAGA